LGAEFHGGWDEAINDVSEVVDTFLDLSATDDGELGANESFMAVLSCEKKDG